MYAQAYWDVPVFGEYQDLRVNRIDARMVNHQEKKVITMEMSCPWVSNRQKNYPLYSPLALFVCVLDLPIYLHTFRLFVFTGLTFSSCLHYQQ